MKAALPSRFIMSTARTLPPARTRCMMVLLFLATYLYMKSVSKAERVM